MKAKIYINKHIVKHNEKYPTDKKPPISISTSKGISKCWMVNILGDSKVVYRPDKPLSCGARVWIECKLEDLIFDINKEEKHV